MGLFCTLLLAYPASPSAVLKENDADLLRRKGEMPNELFFRLQEVIEIQISLKHNCSSPSSKTKLSGTTTEHRQHKKSVQSQKKQRHLEMPYCNGLFPSLPQISPDYCGMRGILILIASSLASKHITDSHFLEKITTFSIR